MAASFDVLESISKVIFILNVYFRSSSALSMSLFKVLITFKLFLCLSRIYPRFLNDPSLPHLTIIKFVIKISQFEFLIWQSKTFLFIIVDKLFFVMKYSRFEFIFYIKIAAASLKKGSTHCPPPCRGGVGGVHTLMQIRLNFDW